MAWPWCGSDLHGDAAPAQALFEDAHVAVPYRLSRSGRCAMVRRRAQDLPSWRETERSPAPSPRHGGSHHAMQVGGILGRGARRAVAVLHAAPGAAV